MPQELSPEKIKQIEADSEKHLVNLRVSSSAAENLSNPYRDKERKAGYVSGATAEALKSSALVEALEFVMKLKPVWQYPDNVPEEHHGEAEAMANMEEKIKSALKNYSSHSVVGEKEQRVVTEASNSDLADVATLRSGVGNSIELSRIIGMSSGGIKAWEDLGSDEINPEGLVDILIEIKAIAEKLSSLPAIPSTETKP